MIRLIIGRKGQGKTTLAYHMARKYSALAVFDPRGLVRRPGAAIARTVDGCSAGFDALAAGDVRELVYTPADPFRASFPHFAGELRRWIAEDRGRELAVLVDELSFVTLTDDDFDHVMKACDETRQHFFLTCHRPADVPTSVRALADYWWLFAIHQEHDLAVIAERCSPAAAAAARELTGRTVISWNHLTGVTRYDTPQLWYVDLHPAVLLTPPLELDTVP